MDFQILVVVVISIYGNTSSFPTCVLMDGNDNLHTGHFSQFLLIIWKILRKV